MNPFEILLRQSPPNNAIAPLFWQHGESESVLRAEIRKMREGGVGGMVVEARPHPDYLGPRWWRDLDSILETAGQQGMRVWLFDDSRYPSGFANGLIRDTHPEYLKIYLAQAHIDAVGPLRGSSFFIQPWLKRDDRLVRVIAARLAVREDELDGDSLIDVTDQVSEGILYWDVPDGRWRVFIHFTTHEGGEPHTKDDLNPLDPAAVQAYIDLIYAPHYQHYAAHFGSTIAGFFTDEPRFGNQASYQARFGDPTLLLPFSSTLLAQLDAAWAGNFGLMLPCLWYDTAEHFAAAGEKARDRLSARVRYAYMDCISRLFSQNFLQQTGDWCRAHGVKLIGHVVEENGAHARSGYGAGHFFRAMSGLDAGGVDVVYHLWPEFTQGKINWNGVTQWDAQFAYWGMIKLASSAAHIDPKKNGLTVCEAFGAYGWQEGLKLMKWITDHLAVRGVNFLIPHAFSPRQNDPDCPPHFYARGENPQWSYYHLLSEYTNRVFHLLSGGVHRAPVAVLYHAEAEWAGAYEPFERAVRTLAEDQIDCDVLPIDVLIDPQQTMIADRQFTIHKEAYRALVIPYAQFLPQSLLSVLVDMVHHDIPVIFTGELPVGGSQNGPGFEEYMEELRASANTAICETDLVEYLQYVGVTEINTSSHEPALRVLHYQKDAADLFFFTNESRDKVIDTDVTVLGKGSPLGYNALTNQVFSLVSTSSDNLTSIHLNIAPYESLFVWLQSYEAVQADPRANPADLPLSTIVDGPWQVSIADSPDGDFKLESRIQGLGNVALPGLLPRFSGTIRYEMNFQQSPSEITGRVLLELGALYEIAAVTINQAALPVRICPPYSFDVSGLLQSGDNTLRIDVTNTLAKARGSQNDFDRGMPQEPSGLIGPVRLLRAS